MSIPSVVDWSGSGESACLIPTTVRELGKDEPYFEDVIAEHPELLELESDGTGTRKPFKVFRQNDFTNALKRTVIPDIMILSASGHITVVEVKLNDNQELRDRRVLAQVIDYAGAFVDRTADELLAIFSRFAPAANTWEELIAAFFPDESNVDLLSDRIMRRLQHGEVNCIVACDKAPPGLGRFLSGISRQSALPFSLSLAEITPFVREDDHRGSVLFVSNVLLTTEIVSRTAVTVRYEEGPNERPSVRVETTPMDEIEQNLAQTDVARSWTEKEIEEAAMSSEPVVKQLFELARTKSNSNQIHSPGKKRSPVFGFYLHGTDSDGVEHTKQVYNYRIGDPTLRIYLNMLETMVSEEQYTQFVEHLKELFPQWTDRDLREPWIPLTQIEERFNEFRELVISVVN